MAEGSAETAGLTLGVPAHRTGAHADVLGRRVAVLADGPLAAGEHRIALDAARLAAGVYVLVLESGGRRTARTVVVAR